MKMHQPRNNSKITYAYFLFKLLGSQPQARPFTLIPSLHILHVVLGDAGVPRLGRVRQERVQHEGRHRDFEVVLAAGSALYLAISRISLVHRHVEVVESAGRAGRKRHFF